MSGAGAPGLPDPPAGPGWRVDWATLERDCPWLGGLREGLAACPQDPVHHAEGDAWAHTRAVCEALAALPAWRALPEGERRTVFGAALLHDAGKPRCSRPEPGGRIATPGHARVGAIIARRLLWEWEVPFPHREAVAALVRFHQLPFFLIEREDPRRSLFEASQTVRCDHLVLLAKADALGRECPPDDRRRMLEHTALFAELAAEGGCLSAPRPFPSDHGRFLYFHDAGGDPDYVPFETPRGEAVVLSGLPGAGKDHWAREHLPQLPTVSLDAIRQASGAPPTGDQRAVLAAARDAARVHLRAGRPLVWNATNLSRRVRRECVDFLAGYGARIRIVYVEAPRATLLRQNRARPRPVPEGAIERLLQRWEVPDLTEAHRLDLVLA